MKLTEGNKYGDYTYLGMWHGTNYICAVCHKERWSGHQFVLGSPDNPAEAVSLGTECIKHDNFWTKLLRLSDLQTSHNAETP